MSQVDSYGAIGDNDSNEGNGAVSTENCDIGNFDSNGANKGIPLSLNERNSAVSTKNCDISDFDSNSANITVLTSLNEGSSANSTKICDTKGDSNGANDKSSINTENCDIDGQDNDYLDGVPMLFKLHQNPNKSAEMSQKMEH